MLGADDPSTLLIRYRIAEEMAAQGDRAGADAEFRDVLAAELRAAGADDPSTLLIRYRIAAEMAAQGDHAGAEAEYRAVLDTQTRVLGAEHPETLAARHRIAEREGGARGITPGPKPNTAPSSTPKPGSSVPSTPPPKGPNGCSTACTDTKRKGIAKGRKGIAKGSDSRARAGSISVPPETEFGQRH